MKLYLVPKLHVSGDGIIVVAEVISSVEAAQPEAEQEGERDSEKTCRLDEELYLLHQNEATTLTTTSGA